VIGASRKPLSSISYNQIMKKSAVVIVKERIIYIQYCTTTLNQGRKLRANYLKRQFIRYQLEAYQILAHGRNCPHRTLISKESFAGQLLRINSIDRSKSFLHGLPFFLFAKILNEKWRNPSKFAYLAPDRTLLILSGDFHNNIR
jgi:hypothetical protein